MPVYGNSRPQFTDINGNPVQAGRLFIGLPDQDPVANPNPDVTDLDGNPISATLILDDVGVPAIPFKIAGDFSQAVFTSPTPGPSVEIPSYQIARTGGFLQESDLVGVSGQGGDWNAGITYGDDDLVKGSDGNYYKSLTDNNLNNDPTAVTTSWSRLAWPTIYNVNEVYDIGDSALAGNGLTYTSLIDSNTGNNPLDDDGTNWTRIRGAFVISSGSQSIPNNTSTTLNFGAEVYDTSVFHDNATNNSRITIPANVSRAKFTARCIFAANSTGDRQLSIIKNGSIFDTVGIATLIPISGSGTVVNIVTGIIDVTPTDYYEISVIQDSGIAIDSTSANFFIEVPQ